MIPEQQIIENIPQLALQQAVDHQIDEVSGSTIYSISEVWQQAELQKHPKVIVATDAQALERAVISAEFEFIYIPASADITQGITRNILERNPLNKRILWEAKGE